MATTRDLLHAQFGGTIMQNPYYTPERSLPYYGKLKLLLFPPVTLEIKSLSIDEHLKFQETVSLSVIVCYI